MAGLSYHCTCITENCGLIRDSLTNEVMPLQIYKLSSDACIRPLFANPVTYLRMWYVFRYCSYKATYKCTWHKLYKFVSKIELYM